MTAVRKIAAVAAVAMALTGMGLAEHAAWAAPAAPAARHRELPPECVNVDIQNQSGTGSTIYARFCGGAANTESPLFDAVSGTGPLLVDGSSLNAASCPSTNRCVVLWGQAPAEGTGEG